MAAPACGNGDYTEQEIAYVLNAAFTGFSAARRESKRFAGASSRAVIHTGFWGCGAFGGNRALMTILQAMAADLAGVDIEFWAFDQAGLQTSRDAMPTNSTCNCGATPNPFLRSWTNFCSANFNGANRMAIDDLSKPNGGFWCSTLYVQQPQGAS